MQRFQKKRFLNIQLSSFYNCLNFNLILIQKIISIDKKSELIMNFHYPGCFFIYYPTDQYSIMNFCNFSGSCQQNQIICQNAFYNKKTQDEILSTSQDQNKNSEIKAKKFKTNKISKMKQKKIQASKAQYEDIEFKHRQQTANRNLCSNTLKVYFKQIRDQKTQTYRNIEKMIEIHKINITISQFIKKINFLFPPTSTYISFDNVKRIFNSIYEGQQDRNFFKIFRISFIRFFKYQIFTVNIKSIRTTRKIRNQQIRQGKLFLRELSQ